MRNKNIIFDAGPLPERIREARLSRGYTMAQLADALDITRQAISQYELGVNTPKDEILSKMINFLEFPINYFYKPIEYRLNNPIFFRSFKTAGKRVRDISRVRIGWMVEILLFLKKYLEFDKVPENLFKSNTIREEYFDEEIEEIALKVRKIFNLGLGPISDVVLLLENHGFIVSKMGLNEKKVDACSVLNTFEDKRPMIFLTEDKTAVHSRFDAAHELGHIVLHSWVDEEYLEDQENLKRIELEAHRFASSFLMPEESFSREVYSTSFESFLPLKRRWKVSIQAMVKRCYDLGIYNKNQYEYMHRQISKRKARTHEPLDNEIPHEQPRTLKKAMQLLIDHKVQSPDGIVESLGFPVKEIEMLCGLDRGTLRDKREPFLRIVR